MIPVPSLSFGGELGQWGERGKDIDKIGNILLSSLHNNNGGFIIAYTLYIYIVLYIIYYALYIII